MNCTNCRKQKLLAHKPIKLKFKHKPTRLHGGNDDLEIVTDTDHLTKCINQKGLVSAEHIRNIENNNVTGILNKLAKDNILTCYFTDSLLKSLATTRNQDPLTRMQYNPAQVQSIYDRASHEAKDFYNENIGQHNLRLDLVQDAVGAVQNVLDYSDYEGEGLDLENNEISDVSQLRLPNSLVELYLKNTQISDVSQLRLPNSLVELYLGKNQISDVSQLTLPDSLVELWLANNQISDVSQLRLPDSLKQL